jgi:hypothetical protein
MQVKNIERKAKATKRKERKKERRNFSHPFYIFVFCIYARRNIRIA